MGARVGGDSNQRKARGWRATDQARLALLAVLVVLPACEGRLAALDPRPSFANLFGAHLEGREPPPGLDRPWPKLSDVPARPAMPDPALRDRISAGLADDRQQSRTPVMPGVTPLAPPAAPTPELGAPPAPARLSSAPAIRFEPAADAQRLPAVQPVPGGQPQAPAAAAAAFAPPPAPSQDLLAPPPGPSPDLLAPRRD